MKKKFRYNPETLSYERVDYSFGYYLRRVLRVLFWGLIFGAGFSFCFYTFFDSPKEEILKQENEALQVQYRVLNDQVSHMQEVLKSLEERDENLYRVIFQADPLPKVVRYGELGGVNRYEELKKRSDSQIMLETTKNIDKLSRLLYIQSSSYDEIVELAANREEQLLALPAIQPVMNKDLSRVASGYGMRIDPIYHYKKFHQGMDFTAPIGTDVFVTGNGKVVFVGWKQGYGNTVEVDHGFGYFTRYAHLSAFKVRVGAKVKRGEIIAAVGNTGKSTGPHLHYEVHYRGQVQNPMNYYFLDLSPDDYDLMMQKASNAGQVLD